MTPSASCLAPTVLRNGARPRAGRRELRWASARPAADATAPPMRLLVVHDSARVVERCMAERSPHDGGHHHQSVSRYTCNADPGRLAESRHSSSPSPLPVQRAPSTRQPRGHTVQYILYIQYSTRSGRVASPASASAGCPVVYKRRVAAPLAAQRDWPPRVGGGGPPPTHGGGGSSVRQRGRLTLPRGCASSCLSLTRSICFFPSPTRPSLT